MFEPRADTETGGQLAVLALFQHSPLSRRRHPVGARDTLADHAMARSVAGFEI